MRLTGATWPDSPPGGHGRGTGLASTVPDEASDRGRCNFFRLPSKQASGPFQGGRPRGPWAGFRLIPLLAAAAWLLPAGAGESLGKGRTPSVEVGAVRRVFHNGEHNAFTDLCRFRGALYLTFRSCPDGHMVHPTASILVLRSADDGRSWEPVHRFRVPLRDTRDPHFLAFRGRLFVYTGTWYSGETTLPRDQYDLNKHLGYGVWTTDGRTWSNPEPLEGTFGHYVWRAAVSRGKAYLCGRRKPGFEVSARGEGERVESLMLESDDGLTWRKASVFQERAGDETAFLFERDGDAVAVARRGGGGDAWLLRSRPPYASWERKSLGQPIGGPLLARWGARYLVGGRKYTPQGPRAALWWLAGDALVEIAELPSGGDTSYPGFVPLSDRRALVSYYSSHERDERGRPITAIYLAELRLRE